MWVEADRMKESFLWLIVFPRVEGGSNHLNRGCKLAGIQWVCPQRED